MSDDVLARIRELVQPSLAAVGVELFDVEFAGAGASRILRVLIDAPAGVTLDDCERASSAVAAVLDAYDPIDTAYHLEVSSPGAERGLRDLDDWRRNVGKLVNVRFAGGDDADVGETVVEGRLVSVGEEAVEVMVRVRRREVAASIPVASIRAGRLAIDI